MRLLPRRRSKIEKLKQAGDADGLRAVLQDAASPRERTDAVGALAALDEGAAEEGLTHALTDPDPAVREAALEALESRAAPTAVDGLLDAVATWPYPQEYAALERAIAILVGWAEEGVAERFVERIVDPEWPPLDERHRDALAAFLEADPRGDTARERLVDELVGGFEGTEHDARVEEVLGWLGTSGADAVLRTLDREPDAAPASAVALAGRLGDSRAVDPLIRLLAAPEAETRAAAAAALGDLNDTRAVQALVGATQDPEHIVRDAASEALNAMGVAAVIVGVASVMREAVREQLGAIGAGEAGATQELTQQTDNSLPAAEELAAAHPPTWAQEVLGRLLRRMGEK